MEPVARACACVCVWRDGRNVLRVKVQDDFVHFKFDCLVVGSNSSLFSATSTVQNNLSIISMLLNFSVFYIVSAKSQGFQCFSSVNVAELMNYKSPL